MAINPSTEFTGRITAPSTAYPYGSAKNESTPGAGDGTPYRKVRADDIFGFQQALLKSRVIVPTGNADEVRASQYLQAIVEIAAGSADFYTDSGVADAYVLNVANADSQGPEKLFDGMKIRFTPSNDCSGGAVTIDPAGLGPVSAKTVDGGDPPPGLLRTTRLAKGYYDASAGYFIIQTPAEDIATSVSAVQFGARGDVVSVLDANITSGSTVCTTTTSTPFLPSDIGKTIIVFGAGVAGARLETTIASFSSGGSVGLAAPASTTVANAVAHYGTDDTAALQAFFDAAGKGQTLYIPFGIYLHTGLTIASSLNLVSDLPHHQFDDDSMNALGLGAVLYNTSLTGDNLTIRPPNAAKRRMEVRVVNLGLVGAKWDGAGFTGATTSGSGLVIDGRSLSETAVTYHLDNVMSTGHSEHGISITGDAYGSDCGYVSTFRNGKNGFRMAATVSNSTGETTIRHIRTFWNGADGSVDADKAGVYFKSAGEINCRYITSTHYVGAAVLCVGGSYNIGTIWTEAVDGAPAATHGIVQFGDGTTAAANTVIDKVIFQPTSAGTYPGNCLLVKANCVNIRVGAFVCNDAIAGIHIKFENATSGCRIGSVKTSGTFVWDDVSGENYIEARHDAFAAKMLAAISNATGDGTQIVVPFDSIAAPGYDKTLAYDTVNYRFVARCRGQHAFNATVAFSNMDGASHNQIDLAIYVNGTRRSTNGATGLKPTTEYKQVSLLYFLNKNDVVDVRAAVSGGAKTVTIGNVTFSLSGFSGHLVAPAYGG